MFDVIFTSLVANVNSFQCDAPQEIWLPGFIGTGGVDESTKQFSLASPNLAHEEMNLVELL